MRPNNRPQKGSTIKVEPIREPKDIRLIKKLLADRSRDLAIFTLGTNTTTGKLRDVTVNTNVQETLQALLASMPDAGGGEFLFQSGRAGRRSPCRT